MKNFTTLAVRKELRKLVGGYPQTGFRVKAFSNGAPPEYVRNGRSAYILIDVAWLRTRYGQTFGWTVIEDKL